MTLRTVAVLVRDDTSLFELGTTAEVFGIDRTEDGVPAIGYRVCAEGGPGPVSTKHHPALAVTATHGLEGLAGADLVIVSATLPHAGSPAELEALRSAHAARAVVLALCTGAFLVAEAGLLNGRRATTHWMYADDLAAAHPDVEVTADEIYIDLGDVVTTAGTASAVDACLHLLRRELGQRVAAVVARRMVAPPQRHGGPAPSAGLAGTLDWALARLHEPLDVAALARHAGVSPRQLTRRFLAEVGTTPLRWITAQRMRRAQELLEQTDLSVERISARVGYGSATQLREHFRRHVGATPARYRDTFRRAAG